MASEVILKKWCDPCLAKGMHVEAETITGSVGRFARDVDVCPDCAEVPNAFRQWLDQYGVKPGSDHEKPPTPKTAAAASASSGSGKSAKPAICYECHPPKEAKSRAALRTHVRATHGLTIGVMERNAEAAGLIPKNKRRKPAVPCPKCEREFDAPQGLANHLKAIHDEAYEKQPTLIVTTRRQKTEVA